MCTQIRVLFTLLKDGYFLRCPLYVKVFTDWKKRKAQNSNKREEMKRKKILFNNTFFFPVSCILF